jgi:hypothetical protein
VQAVRDVAGMVEALRAGARLAFFDLDSPRLPWREALAALRGDLARKREGPCGPSLADAGWT